MVNVKIIAHSRPVYDPTGGTDLITFELTYPRYIHSELLTHRVFSRNASSSRAIPVEKYLAQVEANPVVPTFAANQPGMQAGAALPDEAQRVAEQIWLDAARGAIAHARALAKRSSVHKQWANRLVEPFARIRTVLTGTEWDNFFTLRDSGFAQPEFQQLARAMREAIEASTPVELDVNDWHTPYALTGSSVLFHEEGGLDDALDTSVAGCARVSYLTHDSTSRTLEKDKELATTLRAKRHMSPFEHQATPMNSMRGDHFPWHNGMTHQDGDKQYWSGNLRGWIQYRQILGGA